MENILEINIYQRQYDNNCILKLTGLDKINE